MFRHESFLLVLPFDAGLHAGFILHVKDDRHALRAAGWEEFDLQTYLGLDSPEAPGDVASTTLLFSKVAGQRVDPLREAEEAWPAIFRWQKRQHHRWWVRWRSLPVARAARQLLRPSPQLRRSLTVVQAVRLAPRAEHSDEEWRFSQLDRSLGHLNDFLTAVMSIRRDPEITVVGRRDLPPLVFGFGWDVHADGRRSDVEWQGYVMHDRLPSLDPPLTREQADLATWISASREHPLKHAGDFILSAHATLARGRYRHAVADAGTAVEMLIAATLRLAGPQRGYQPAKLQNILDGGFASQVKDHFAPLMGYDTDPVNGTDALADWWQRGYLLRNRVVHNGHEPTEDEAFDAVEAAEALHHDLGGRVSKQPDLQALLLEIPDEVVEAVEPAAPPERDDT